MFVNEKCETFIQIRLLNCFLEVSSSDPRKRNPRKITGCFC